MWLRASYGGISCDVDLCLIIAHARTITSHKKVTSNHLQKESEDILQAKCAEIVSKVANLELSSAFQLPCAVDFHCSPEICAFGVKHLASRAANRVNVTEAEVKKWIWHTRSGVNLRHANKHPERDAPAWWDLDVNRALDQFARGVWSKQAAPRAVESGSTSRSDGAVGEPPNKKPRQVSLLRFFGAKQ